MDLTIELNEYLLVWNMLYGASLSNEIDLFKKKLYTKFKKEYNFCYKDKQEILKYGNDFIPDNDILYNAVFESPLYITLKKETIKHKTIISKCYETNKEVIDKAIGNVLRLNLPKEIKLYIIHPRFEIKEYVNNYNCMIWGSEKDKHDFLTILIYNITNSLVRYDDKYKEIAQSILELAVINEIGEQITHTHTYVLGEPRLKIYRRQIYPFWLMYLGYTEEKELLNKMIEDKIGFDIDRYPMDKNMKKINLQQFIDFCIKNQKRILKVENINKIEEQDNDLELI